MVLLGAGLDTRAFRPDWPDGVRLSEVDPPGVLDFKESVVTAAGARARCRRSALRSDLADDWAEPLLAAGPRPDRPTAWLIEGVLCYLTGPEADHVLSTVSRLSAPGSTLAGEHVSLRVFDDPVARPMLDALESVGAPWRSGVEDAGRWLGAYGWRAGMPDLTDPAVHHGRLADLDRTRLDDGPPRGWIFSAVR
ncbi:hypothetical protein GCM10009678_65310 [Actinomadura kijaniata]|uniref:S-adenosyl-L-methionine-dependent methyltransferase n=1 Tax=Actinomadura namibiensis TaxID=182080 RepID=A0A7W3LY67_ACTNM|nr:methyltransferase (TIGR00027 family) [Actinomadura namibiensis]